MFERLYPEEFREADYFNLSKSRKEVFLVLKVLE